VTVWWEQQRDDPPGFAQWFRSLSHFDASDPGEVEAESRAWFVRYFADNGPAAAEGVGDAYRRLQVEVASRAVTAVRADLARATSVPIDLAVEEDEWGGTRLAVNGRRSGEPIWGIDTAKVLVQVADDIQTELADIVIQGRTRFWPECTRHNAGLHAELRDGRAVWWCRGGDHESGEIGHLPS